MILNQEYNLAYVHIPKCAGSTVKSQLRPIDQTQGRFERIEPHPVYGSLHTAHLPLWLLRALYPDDYEALRGCDAYTVVRDPFDRFQSALAQRIRQFHDRDPFELTPTELRKEINAVVRFLSDNPNDPRLEYMHFLRQTDFIYLDGTAVVRHIYKLDSVDLMLRALEPKTGLNFVYTHKANQKMNFRIKALRKPAYAANIWIKKELPMALYSRLKGVATAVLTGSPGDFSATVLDTEGVRPFIRSYYKDDFALYAAATGRDTPPGG